MKIIQRKSADHVIFMPIPNFGVVRYKREFRLVLNKLIIGREKSGILYKRPVWICTDPYGYLYIAPSFLKLIICLLFEWKHDKHLIG